MSQPTNNNNNNNDARRGIFHYHTECMIVPPNVRKVTVDSSSLRILPYNVFYGQTRMYQLDFVSGDGASESDNNNDENNHHILYEIGDYAFHNCRILTAFYPPPTVTVIGPRALWGCSSLMHVSLGKQLKAIQEGTFAFCGLLESIQIPGSVEVIGYEAFMECNSLNHLEFEEGRLKIIEDRAFAGCHFLAKVSIPSTLEIIGNNVFKECRCLRHANLAPAQGRLKSIGTEAFAHLLRLEKVNIPAGLETIGVAAFRGCETLKSVTTTIHPSSPPPQDNNHNNETTTTTTTNMRRIAQMPVELEESAKEIVRSLHRQGHRNISLPYGFHRWPSAMGLQLEGCTRLVSFGERCFQDCRSLGSLSIPSPIETLSKSIFEHASYLVHVQLAEGLRVIQAEAFQVCMFLRAIKVPSTVTIIQEKAFALCLSLVSVGIPKKSNLQSLGRAAFDTCDSLLNIWLPPQVVSSLSSSSANELRVFSGCTQLISKYGADQTKIVQGLADRFQDRPIHELCYHDDDDHDGQPPPPPASTLLQDLNAPHIAASSDCPMLLMDPLGMNPCHILASSTNNVRMDLFQALMDTFPRIPLLCTMDHSGNYVLDYLYTNTGSSSSSSNDDIVRLEQLVFEKTLTDRIRRLGKPSWGNQVEEACSMPGNDPSLCPPRSPGDFHQALHQAYVLLERYERLEMAVLLELIVWKMALKKTNGHDDDASITTTTTTERREYCRVKSGADAVMDSIMPFLIEPP